MFPNKGLKINRKLGLLVGLLVVSSVPIWAGGFNWASITMDNDTFVGEDSGYTNGLFFSIYEVEEDRQKGIIQPDIFVKPLLWLTGDKKASFAINSYTLGQVMVTPEDISDPNPPEDELPYSGLLSVTNSYVRVFDTYADRFSTTLGVVGPSSGAEATQKFIHEIIGSREPQGWDTQIKDEIVFEFSRARLWRVWASGAGLVDVLTQLEGTLGTIESSVGGGGMIRIGKNLDQSFFTPLYVHSRAANPVSPSGGWFGFLGLQGGYVFHLIHTDGNTFRDSRSIDYDPEQLGVAAGFTYSWQNWVLSLALNETNVFLGSDNQELEGVTRYGTLTFGFRF